MPLGQLYVEEKGFLPGPRHLPDSLFASWPSPAYPSRLEGRRHEHERTLASVRFPALTATSNAAGWTRADGEIAANEHACSVPRRNGSTRPTSNPRPPNPALIRPRSIRRTAIPTCLLSQVTRAAPIGGSLNSEDLTSLNR